MTWLGWFGWLGAAAVGLVACTGDRIPFDDTTTSSSTTDSDAPLTSSPASDGETEPPTGGSPQVCEGEDGWLASEGGGASGGGGDGSSSSGPPVGMDDDMPLLTSIPEVQLGGHGIGTWVLVEGAVVTTTRVPRQNVPGTEVFVQDPEGGPWSGLRVLVSDGASLAPLTPGDRVDVVGRVVQRGDFFAVQLSSVDPQLVPVGSGELPPPALVPVEWLELEDADGRAYESVPVRVEQVIVTDDDPCDGELVLEDVVRVDDRFIPGLLPAPPAGTVLSAVEGVLVFSEDSLEISPRDPGAVG